MNAIFKYNRDLINVILSSGSMALLMLTISIVMMSGCTGLQTFSQVARPGDTVALAIHRQDIRRGQATIIVEDSTGYSQSFSGADPRVHGWINIYPDPVSKLIVGRETAQSYFISSYTFGWLLDFETGSEKDIYETTLFLDLPLDLAPGIATIDVQHGGASILQQLIEVDVLPTVGTSHPFQISGNGPGGTSELGTFEFRNLGRGKHYTITFSGSTVPEAIELDFTHDPDRENGGAGQAYVINPRGDIKSITWTDTGTDMKVLTMSAWQKTVEDIAGTEIDDAFGNLPNFERFKFYVAGEITGLLLAGINAYDLNGDPVPGVNALVDYSHD